MTGLAKQVLEIPIVGGLSQQIAPEVAPPGALYDLTNVEIDRIGNASRRHGHELMTNAAFVVGTNSVSSTMGTPRKIGGRADELWVISAESYYLGSGGGGGAAGDMLWTYSPELDAWKPHSHVPRPTLERWAGLSNSGLSPEHASVGFVQSGDTRLIVVAYAVVQNGSGNVAGLHVTVFDATSRAIIIEDQVLDTDPCGKARVVSIGGKAMIVWLPSLGSVLKFSVFDAANADDGFSAAANLASATASSSVWTTCTDGTSLFLFYIGFASFNARLERFDTAGASAGAVLIDNAASGINLGCCVAGGRVHMAWISGVARYASITTAGAGLTSPINVGSGAADQAVVAALDADNATVFYSKAQTLSSPPTVMGSAVHELFWRQISGGSSAPAAAATEHETINLVIQSDPFVFDNRVFLPVTGADLENEFRSVGSSADYSGYGHAIVEVSQDTGTGSAYMSLFPVAVWSRDASKSNGGLAIPSAAFGDDSDRYLCSLRLVRNIDRFGGGAQNPGGGSLSEPVVATTEAYGIDVIRLAFDDKKRWAHSEINSCVDIASALPFSYDGLLAHECGFVFRPEITGIVEDGVGSFQANDEPTYHVTYEWEDVHGDRWISDTSFAAQRRIVAVGGTSLTICVRLLTLSAKPLGGNYSYGRIKVQLHRAMSSAREDFQKIGEKYIDLYGTSNVTFNDDGADDFQSAERLYTVGGELDNGLQPPCRALTQHGARLACISTDDGKLWLTKETRFQRGIEWSPYLTVPLPQRGMALASSEAALIVLCEKSIYALEGYGPDALGQPPNSWRLTLLSHDKGCSEINASWRTPAGILYRGYQGLWMIGGQLGFSFIGEAVSDFTDQVERFVDGALDTRHARLRLLCLMDSGDYRVLNYWYDSNRWSIDTIEESEGTQFSSTVFQGTYHRALSSGVYKASETLFRDALATPLYLASVRTGWLRMGAMHEFKRVWRGLATVGKIRAEEAEPVLDLQFTIENENGICASKTFSSSLFPALSDWAIRMHLAKQKGKAFRMQLTEVPNDDTENFSAELGGYVFQPPGYTYTSLGLEYGVKRGAAKLPATRTK